MVHICLPHFHEHVAADVVVYIRNALFCIYDKNGLARNDTLIMLVEIVIFSLYSRSLTLFPATDYILPVSSYKSLVMRMNGGIVAELAQLVFCRNHFFHKA